MPQKPQRHQAPSPAAYVLLLAIAAGRVQGMLTLGYREIGLNVK